MKIKTHNTKQRTSQAKPSPFSSLNSSMIKIQKQQSKHTKSSTNITTPSLHNTITTTKKLKQKKPELQNEQKKQKTIRQTQLVTSGRSKPLKQKMKNKKSCDFSLTNFFSRPNAEQGSVSYREYCLVQDSFVPIVSKNEIKQLQDIMRSTANTTTNRCEQLNRSTFRNVFPFKLKEKSEKSFSGLNNEQDEQGMFKRSKKVSRRQVQISASPFYEQIGIQYSQRPQLSKRIVEQIKEKKAIQVNIQTDEQFPSSTTTTISPVKLLDQVLDQTQHPSEQKQQTLSDLLLKLQFKHLPNQTAFNTLSKTEKQHYSELLNSLISKLNCSPREKSPRQLKTKQEIEIEEVKLIPLEEIKIKHEKLQMEVFRRESCQMNWMQRRFPRTEDDEQDKVDTSIMAVNSFLLNFFCYIELNYMEDFLNNIKKQYGPTYCSQFTRLTRKLIGRPAPLKVLHQAPFQQFCQQLSEVSIYEKIHLKAIFDYINELLDSYRPYFQHHGEPFPWSMKMYNNICEYVIDEGSLEIIFVEVKENIQKSVAMLCGLIVDQTLLKDVAQDNPLAAKRNQKENVMMEAWMNEKTEENHQLECQATVVLNEMNDQIYNMLLLEVVNQMLMCNGRSR